MILNYKEIISTNNKGVSLKKIWEEMTIPVKYGTFVKAVNHYKKTGKERNIRIKLSEEKSAQIVMEKLDNITIGDIGEIEPKPIEIKKDKEEIIKLLRKGATLEELGSDPTYVLDTIEHLRDLGYSIMFREGMFKINSNPKKVRNEYIQDWNGNKHLKIGVVSDTHIGNINNQMTFLHYLYDRYKEMGITDVYHVGDISDGWYPNRSDQIYELYAHGADQQVDYIVKNYPKRDGITTHFIIGNHDYTFIRNTGYNIGPAIAMRRDDMKYLGAYNARVWLTPNCDIELNHPSDGAAYAMSYSIQKYIDSMSGGDKPKILLNGHHHKFLTMFYRNVHAIECPCLEAQTTYMKGKRIAAHMGGLILDIHVDEEGTIQRFGVELIPLYRAIKNDYK